MLPLSPWTDEKNDHSEKGRKKNDSAISIKVGMETLITKKEGN